MKDFGVGHSHPVQTQLCLAVSSCILHFLADSTTTTQSFTLHATVNDLISRNLSLDLILTIVSTIPELCISIKEYLFPISEDLITAKKTPLSTSSPQHIHHGSFSEYANRKGGPANVNETIDQCAVKVFQLKERLLQETSVVERTATNALTGDDSNNVKIVLRCCTNWVEFISQNDTENDNKTTTQQHFKKKVSPSVRPVLDLTLVSAVLGGWLSSSILQHAVSAMAHTIHSLGDLAGSGSEDTFPVFEGCCELLTAVCEAGKMGHSTELAIGLATQMLPMLSSLLTSLASVSTQAVPEILNSSGGVEHCERLTQHALAATRMVSDCSVSLLPSLTTGTGTGGDGDGGDSVITLWRSFVADLVSFLGAQVNTVLSLPFVTQSGGSLSNEQAEVIVSLRQYCQDAVESSAPFSLQFTQRIYGSSSSTLPSLFSGHIQSLLIIAVQVSACIERPELLRGALSLQHQEAAGEYRSFLRETLRDVVLAEPSVADWLLDSCIDCLRGYVATVSASFEADYGSLNSVGDLLQLGGGWALSEALLHAVTAITKYVLNSTSAVSAEQIGRVYTLLHLLSTSVAATHCRPLARMTVVVISELLPGLIKACTSSESVSSRDANPSVDLLRQLFQACVNYLLVSITTHSELACRHDNHCTFESTSSSLTLDERAQHGLHTNNQLPRTLHLELQGWFLVFRVKQDHIGAVSLCKLFTAVFVAGEYSSKEHIERARRVVSHIQTLNLPARLTSVVSKLAEIQQLSASGDESHRMFMYERSMRASHFTLSPQYDTVTSVLAYCLYYLSILQTCFNRLHTASITAKSFNLVYFALCTALSSTVSHPVVCSDNSRDINNMSQIAAPATAAIVALLVARRQQITNQGSVNENELNALLNQVSASLIPIASNAGENEARNRDETLHVVVSVGQTLSHTCTLSQLVLMLNELVVTAATHLWGESVHAGKKNPAFIANKTGSSECAGVLNVLKSGAKYHTFLTLLEALLPSLSFLTQPTLTAEQQSHYPFVALLSFSELEAANKLVMAMSALPLTASLRDGLTSEELAAVGQRVLALLNSLYAILHALLQATHQQSPLLVQAACQMMRTLCTWRSAVDVAELFRRMFQAVSSFGIMSLQSGTVAAAAATAHAITSNNNTMNIHRVNKRDKRTLQRLNNNKHEYGVLLLCEYWAVCLSASELLPVSRLSDGVVSTSQISVGLMGWSALQSIVDTACTYILQANHDAVMCYYSDDESDARGDSDEKATFGTATWRQVVGILTLMMGPVVRQEGFGGQQTELTAMLAADGHLTGNAAKAVLCGEAPCGQPELIDLLVRSELQLVDRLFKSILCGISGSLPSDLREELSKALQKAYVCFGTKYASQSVFRALFDQDYPVNGSVMSEEGKTTFVSQLQSYALGGDWKRWRNIVKVLSKG